MNRGGSNRKCSASLWRTFTRLQVHEEHDVGTLPHSPEELDHPGRAENAPRAHLLQAEASQRNLGSDSSWSLKRTPCFQRPARLTLLAAQVNPVAASRTQKTSP